MFSTTKDDDMVECPYNKYHQMTRKRLIPHLLKCRLSYPDAELVKCPFNASHLIPEPEFTHHVANCKDKAIIHQYKYNTLPVKIDAEDRKQVEIDCDENWDDTEVDDYDPNKYVSKANVIRTNIGNLPSVRKQFTLSERKRLGDEDSDDDEEAQKTFGKRVYKDMDSKAKEELKEKNRFEDIKSSSSSSKNGSQRRDSYEESLKGYSRERGRDEDFHRKSIKRESRGSDEEDESSSRNKYRRSEEKDDDRSERRRRRSPEYPLDDDPYYKTNNRPSYLGMSRGARRGYSYRK